MDRERVVVAEILRARGIRGEVIARSQTDVPGRLEHLKTVSAGLPDGSVLPLQLLQAWKHKGDWVLKFAGIDSRDDAERLRGADLWVPLSNRGELAEGEFFRSDLVGCVVIDRRSGEQAGVVAGWQQYGGAPLMEVKSAERERLIPFVGSLCEVDLTARTIRTELPEGLLDL